MFHFFSLPTSDTERRAQIGIYHIWSYTPFHTNQIYKDEYDVKNRNVLHRLKIQSIETWTNIGL